MNNLEYWLDQNLKGNEIALDLPEDKQDLNGLTIIEAIKAHEAWIQKLELTLKGQNPEEYDPDIVSADHLCKLGSWLYGDGEVLSSHDEYHQLKEAHKEFHQVAGGILKNHKNGKFAAAIMALRKDLVEASKKVKVALVKLLIAIS